MAVKSTVFGGVKLTGSEADKFRNQVRYGRPKQAAVESAVRGDSLRLELAEKGRVVIHARKVTAA